MSDALGSPIQAQPKRVYSRETLLKIAEEVKSMPKRLGALRATSKRDEERASRFERPADYTRRPRRDRDAETFEEGYEYELQQSAQQKGKVLSAIADEQSGEGGTAKSAPATGPGEEPANEVDAGFADLTLHAQPSGQAPQKGSRFKFQEEAPAPRPVAQAVPTPPQAPAGAVNLPPDPAIINMVPAPSQSQHPPQGPAPGHAQAGQPHGQPPALAALFSNVKPTGPAPVLNSGAHDAAALEAMLQTQSARAPPPVHHAPPPHPAHGQPMPGMPPQMPGLPPGVPMGGNPMHPGLMMPGGVAVMPGMVPHPGMRPGAPMGVPFVPVGPMAGVPGKIPMGYMMPQPGAPAVPMAAPAPAYPGQLPPGYQAPSFAKQPPPQMRR